MTQKSFNHSLLQNIAAWMLLVGVLVFNLLQMYGYQLLFDGYSDNYITFYRIEIFVGALVKGSAYLLLALSASNLSGRLLGFVFMGLNLNDIILSFFNFSTTVYIIYIMLITIVIVWLFSVLLKNNELSAVYRSWVNLLLVLKLSSLCYACYLIVGPEFTPFTGSSEYGILLLFVMLMMAIGCWKLARSEAFAGNYDSSVHVSLVPGLKHSLAFGIGFLVMLLVIVLIYAVS